MLKIFQESKIYVFCPYGITTGGTETLHQLVSNLNDLGKEAYIYYYNIKLGKKASIPIKFQRYNLKVTDKILDNKENILVLPETDTQFLYKFKNIQKCIWWLSVDFYLKGFPKDLAKKHPGYKKENLFYWLIVLKIILKEKKFKMLDFKKDNNINNYTHFYNCEYARLFLLTNGVKEENTKYLCGPLGDEYFEGKVDIDKKIDIVAFNPAKGYEYSKKVIEYITKVDDNIIFVPIKDMNVSQIKTLLRKSKGYMDFGFFPGPERIPREAAISYCNIVASNIGSAANDIDVPIGKDNKFTLQESAIEQMSQRVLELVYNYRSYVDNYNVYRDKVIDQKSNFRNYVKKAFNIE